MVKWLTYEEASDHERSILLVEIMNAIGFSKSEREINKHGIHLLGVFSNNFTPTDKGTSTLAGSNSEGMCGGFRDQRSQHDCDILYTARYIKLYTPRTNNIKSPLPLLLHDNEDYDASFSVNEDDNFPGYVKLSLAEMKISSPLTRFIIKNDDKHYFSNSLAMYSLL